MIIQNKKKKYLFITHDTSRSGAPIIVLQLLKWLRDNQNVEIHLLSLGKGSLQSEFISIVDAFHEIPKDGLVKRLLNKILNIFFKNRFGFTVEKLISRLSNEGFDLIYANSVASLPFAQKIKRRNSKNKIISHIHEMDTVIQIILPSLSEYFDSVDQIIVPALLVKKSLIENYDAPEDKIFLIREFSHVSESMKEKKDNFLVGASGSVHWRKGPDIFIQVAKYIRNNYPEVNISFRWVGAISPKERKIVEADLTKLKLDSIVSFVGEKQNPHSYYQDFDIFLLPSREDPFPLVGIEVGMLGKPIVCFQMATGITEVLENGGGSVLPYLDIELMAEEVVQYYRNPLMLKSEGLKSKEIFSQFTAEKICPEIYNIMTSVK